MQRLQEAGSKWQLVMGAIACLLDMLSQPKSSDEWVDAHNQSHALLDPHAGVSLQQAYKELSRHLNSSKELTGL